MDDSTPPAKTRASDALLATPCRVCGQVDRYATTGACRACRIAYLHTQASRDTAKRCRLRRKEKVLAEKRRYRERNRERIRAAARAAYKPRQPTQAQLDERAARKQARRVRDAQLAADKAARKAAREAARLTPEERAERTRIYNINKKHARKRAKRAGGTPATAAQIRQLLERQYRRCAYCSSPHDLHLDHKQALSRGGDHTYANLQWLCGYHNMNKHATPDAVYRSRHGIPAITPWDGHVKLLLV